MGEAGINRHDSSTSTNSKVSSRTPNTSSPYKLPPRKSPEEEAQNMVKNVIGIVMEKEKAKRSTINEDLSIENQSLSELMQLVDMYMKTMEFRRNRGSLTPEREEQMTSQIDYVMEIIENRQTRKKRRIDDDNMEDNGNNNNNVS